ncbi:MAG: type II CRISPR RNA-guided endonuclease Cas9 [Sulfuricellaceae bacterium]|jgi:CRISPR-associated endonuclease Csn1
MVMPYRLALDIGTASLGLVAVSLDERGEPGQVLYSDLRIFSEPLLPAKAGGVGEPKKAARRLARQSRRLIERRSRRLRHIAHLAPLIGVDAETVHADSGQRIHRLRALAAHQRIELPDFLNVLLKLAKRRGYGGSFRVKGEGEEGKVEHGIKQLRQQLEGKTLGEWLLNRHEKGESLKLKESGLYAHREMVEEEFNRIWDEQEKHHPSLRGSAEVGGREQPIRRHFFEAIFHQRPLKSVSAMVGNCPLEPTLPRAPWAQPAAQAFRIEKQLADLRWGMGRQALPLSEEQRAFLRALLADPAKLTKEGKISFKKVYEALEGVGLRPSHRNTFNADRFSREELKGDTTRKAMQGLGMLGEWEALTDRVRVQIINLLADLDPAFFDDVNWPAKLVTEKTVKNPQTGEKRLVRKPRQLLPETVAFINRLVDGGQFDRLGKMGFDGGRAGYSIKALQGLTAAMISQGVDEHGARQACYPQEEKARDSRERLSLPPVTGNVVVDVALRMVWRAVNDAIGVLGGPPAQTIVEMTRDMALGLKARGEIEKKIDRNRREREKAKKELSAHGKAPTNSNVLRYLLWSQLDQKYCPYCEEIVCMDDALDGNKTHIDHILPRSLTRVGRQRSHLILAHRWCNHEKGDRTPFEAFGHDSERWNLIQHRASVLKANKQFNKARYLLLQDYEGEVLDDKAIADFSERQFHETSWIAKLTAQWMREVCADVAVSRGELIAQLRQAWRLTTVIPQVRLESGLPVLDEDGKAISAEDFERYKACWEGHRGEGTPQTDRRPDKRIDHRHHLIDALVIAQSSRGLYQRMARQYKALAERRQAGEPVRLRAIPEPPMAGLRDKALELVRHATVRHKPDRHPAGAFFQQTAYRKVYTEEGKIRLAVRAELSALTDANGSLDKARKGIADIVSPETRAIVSAAFEQRIAAGQGVKEALSTPIPDPRYGRERPRFIKKVRVYQRIGRGFIDGENAIAVTHRQRDGTVLSKHYLSDGYAYVALKTDNGKLAEANSVSLWAAVRRSAKPGEGEVRYYPNETLVDSETGQHYVVRQIKADATLMLTLASEAREVRDMDASTGLKVISGKGLLKFRHAE